MGVCEEMDMMDRELEKLRMWLKRREYSAWYIQNVLANLKNLEEEFGRIPSYEEVREKYWYKHKLTRRYALRAVRVWNQFKEVEKDGQANN